MSKKNMNQIYLSLEENTVIDGERLNSDDDYLGAVTEKIANLSDTGMDGCDLQDWLIEGQWTGGKTIAQIVTEWDEVNE